MKLILHDKNGLAFPQAIINGQPMIGWKAAAETYGIGSYREVWKRLPAGQKGVTTCDSAGGLQKMLFVTIGALFLLILRGTSPAARQFQEQVATEIIPQLVAESVADIGRTLMESTQVRRAGWMTKRAALIEQAQRYQQQSGRVLASEFADRHGLSKAERRDFGYRVEVVARERQESAAKGWNGKRWCRLQSEAVFVDALALHRRMCRCRSLPA